MATGMKTERATLGGGCFWCLEAVFQGLRGVYSVESGYAGGHTDSPSYQDVCKGDTGHAEVVQIQFDPQVISYMELLKIFFTLHDPTTLNRQGADQGTQYRSVIFYHNQEQKETAARIMQIMASVWADPFVTELQSLPIFYPAEDFHRNFYLNFPNDRYCEAVIAPKIVRLRKFFMDKLRDE